MSRLPDTDPEEVYWRERIAEEILGEAMARDLEERAGRRRHTHPKEGHGFVEAARIAREGL